MSNDGPAEFVDSGQKMRDLAAPHLGIDTPRPILVGRDDRRAPSPAVARGVPPLPGGADPLAGREDITIRVWTGPSETEWQLKGEIPPLVCIGVLLDGKLEILPQNGPPLTLRAGTTVLHAVARPVAGQDTLPRTGAFRLVDVRYGADAFLPILHALAIAAPPPIRGGGAAAAWDGAIVRQGPTSTAARRVATEILASDGFDDPIRTVYLRAKALELLAVVLRDMASGVAESLPLRDRKRVVLALHLLEECYGETWTTARLACRVGLSEKKLQAGFRQVVGASVHTHLRAMRMAAAMAMLGRGMSVTETAYAIGFSSLSHFSKAFKDHSGMSPQIWAKQHADA